MTWGSRHGTRVLTHPHVFPEIRSNALLENSANLGCDRYCLGTMSALRKLDLGVGQNLLLSILMGWTSIYQLFWGSLGARVLTNSHFMLIDPFLSSRFIHGFIHGFIHEFISEPQQPWGKYVGNQPWGTRGPPTISRSFHQGQDVLSMKGFNPPACGIASGHSLEMSRWRSLTQGLPSGYVKIAIENGHRNSGLTHWKWWFSIVMLNLPEGRLIRPIRIAVSYVELQWECLPWRALMILMSLGITGLWSTARPGADNTTWLLRCRIIQSNIYIYVYYNNIMLLYIYIRI